MSARLLVFIYLFISLCVCACVCVRTCVRAFVCVCVRVPRSSKDTQLASCACWVCWVVSNLKRTFQARFVVVVPTKYYSRPALRLELYGCSVSGPPASMGTDVTEDIKVCVFRYMLPVR